MKYRTPFFTLDTENLSVLDKKNSQVKIYNKDYEVLLFLCKSNRAVSGSEIIDAVWSKNEQFSSNVVATAIANLRRALWKDAIRTIRNCYIIEDQIKESFYLKRKFLILGILLCGGLFWGFFIWTKFITSFNEEIIVTELHINPNWNDNEHLEDEWMLIKNTTDSLINMQWWTISDNIGHSYVFTDRILQSQQELKFITWKCENTKTQECWNFTDYAIWNNDTDEITIKDKENRIVYKKTYSY